MVTVATKSVRKTTPAKKTPAEKTAAKKTAVKKAAVKKAARPVKNATPVAKPVKKTAAKTAVKAAPAPSKRTTAKKTAAAPAPAAPRRAPRQPRPLLQVVRRPDGRALSFTERLEEKMHKQFGHAGPICHQCRTNASRLALIAGA